MGADVSDQEGDLHYFGEQKVFRIVRVVLTPPPPPFSAPIHPALSRRSVHTTQEDCQQTQFVYLDRLCISQPFFSCNYGNTCNAARSIRTLSTGNSAARESRFTEYLTDFRLSFWPLSSQK